MASSDNGAKLTDLSPGNASFKARLEASEQDTTSFNALVRKTYSNRKSHKPLQERMF